MCPSPRRWSRPAHAWCVPAASIFLHHQPQSEDSYLSRGDRRRIRAAAPPQGTHDYQCFIKPSELSRFARDAGLRTAELIGMTYNPLTERYRLEADCDVQRSPALLRD